jgi:hypothetical protein
MNPTLIVGDFAFSGRRDQSRARLLSRSLWNLLHFIWTSRFRANVDRAVERSLAIPSFGRKPPKLHMRLTGYYSEEGFADRLVAPLTSSSQSFHGCSIATDAQDLWYPLSSHGSQCSRLQENQ